MDFVTEDLSLFHVMKVNITKLPIFYVEGYLQNKTAGV
jgi:hypothetical protein